MLMLACASIYMDAQSFWFKELLISGLVVVYLYVSLHHHSVDFCFSYAQWQSLCWGLHRKWNKDLMSPSGDWNFTSNHLAKGSNPSFCIIFLKILGEPGPLPSSSLGFATGFTVTSNGYLDWNQGSKSWSRSVRLGRVVSASAMAGTRSIPKLDIFSVCEQTRLNWR